MPLRRFTPGLVLLAVVTMTLPARALVSAIPDDDVHPFVGLAVFGSGGAVTHACSGVLVAPTVFVTAGHCTDGVDIALVWFESEVTFSASTAHTGVPMSHPAFSSFTSVANSSDVGVVILEEPVDLAVYAALPDVGSLAGAALELGDERASFTVVGYGLRAVASFMQDEDFRYRGTGLQVELNTFAIDDYTLQLFGDQVRRAPDGACFGDSGGPAMVGATNVVAGVGSFTATPNCAGAGTYYRLDTDYAQEFIRSFMR